MCPCDPNDLNITQPDVPGIPLNGFDIAPVAPQLPTPDFEFPELPDFSELIQDLFQKLPFNMDLKAILSIDLQKSISNIITQVLGYLAPFLSIYNFFQALLNIILCIIDVLCAIPRPIALIRAIIRLFRRCIPDFLSLFPWIALLVIIIYFLLLLIALIIFIIETIAKIVRDILANITNLSRAITEQNEQGIIATIRKLALLLCNIENLLSILAGVASIIAIIETLAGLSGRFACAGGNGSGCCDEDVCPPIIKDNPEGLQGTNLSLQYLRRVNYDVGSFPPALIDGLPPPLIDGLPPQREETWQIYDQSQEFENSFRQFGDILLQGESSDVWPDNNTYDENSDIRTVPYTVDFTLDNFNPLVYHPGGLPSGNNIIRDFVVRESIVTKRPDICVQDYQNDNDCDANNRRGVLSVTAGEIYEADGYTRVQVFDDDGNAVDATLNNFIHLDSVNSIPASNDAVTYPASDYTVNYNYVVLLEYNLIVLGCIPEVVNEIEAVNSKLAAIGVDSVFDKMGPLPDINSALDCAFSAIDRFSNDFNEDTAVIFEEEITQCLNDLKDESVDSYIRAVCAGTSQFNTQTSLEPDMQFITRPIEVSVDLVDETGALIAENMPEDAQQEIGSRITADVTLGEISEFVYDGYTSFKANLTSDEAGDGEMTISVCGKVLQDEIEGDDDTPPSFEIRKLLYSFVESGIPEDGIRRDARDVAQNRGG